jgi:hypothetical protein
MQRGEHSAERDQYESTYRPLQPIGIDAQRDSVYARWYGLQGLMSISPRTNRGSLRAILIAMAAPMDTPIKNAGPAFNRF